MLYKSYFSRNQLFEKAFRLAIDLNDHDLFMDIHFYAVAMKNSELANAAREKAEQILSRSNSCNSSRKYFAFTINLYKIFINILKILRKKSNF